MSVSASIARFFTSSGWDLSGLKIHLSPQKYPNPLKIVAFPNKTLLRSIFEKVQITTLNKNEFWSEQGNIQLKFKFDFLESKLFIELFFLKLVIPNSDDEESVEQVEITGFSHHEIRNSIVRLLRVHWHFEFTDSLLKLAYFILYLTYGRREILCKKTFAAYQIWSF